MDTCLSLVITRVSLCVPLPVELPSRPLHVWKQLQRGWAWRGVCFAWEPRRLPWWQTANFQSPLWSNTGCKCVLTTTQQTRLSAWSTVDALVTLPSEGQIISQSTELYQIFPNSVTLFQYMHLPPNTIFTFYLVFPNKSLRFFFPLNKFTQGGHFI